MLNSIVLDNGRPAKPARAKVGLLILKHLYQFSDEELVDLLKRDIYAQYLCDISLKEAKDFINSSTLEQVQETNRVSRRKAHRAGSTKLFKKSKIA